MIAERDKISRELFTMNEPKSYRTGDTENVVVILEQTFAALVAMLESNGTHVTDNTTCFAFYGKIEYMNKTVNRK